MLQWSESWDEKNSIDDAISRLGGYLLSQIAWFLHGTLYVSSLISFSVSKLIPHSVCLRRHSENLSLFLFVFAWLSAVSEIVQCEYSCERGKPLTHLKSLNQIIHVTHMLSFSHVYGAEERWNTLLLNILETIMRFWPSVTRFSRF